MNREQDQMTSNIEDINVTSVCYGAERLVQGLRKMKAGISALTVTFHQDSKRFRAYITICEEQEEIDENEA